MLFRRKKQGDEKDREYATEEEKKRLLVEMHDAVRKLPPMSIEFINKLERNTNDKFFYGGVKNEEEMKLRSQALHESMLGNYQKAADLCSEGLKINPGSAYLLHMRGRSYADLGRSDEATSDLGKVLTMVPDSAETMYEMANALLNLSMYDDALYYAHKAAEIEPDSYRHCAVDMEGVVDACMGRWDESIRQLDRALEIKPGYEHALLTKASVLGWKGYDLNHAGKHKAALECYRGMLACYEDVLEGNPRNFVAAIEMGVAMHYLGMHDEAVGHFRAVLNLGAEGDYEIASTALAHMGSHRHDKVVKLLDAAFGGYPRDVSAVACRGILLEIQGRYGDALGWYLKALKSRTKDLFLLPRVGNVLVMLGDGAGAVKYLDRILKLDASNAIALSVKGSALSVQGKHKEAVEYYDRALEIDPRDTVTIHNKGRAMAEMGLHVDAVRQYNIALGEDPRDASALHDMGVSLVELGRLDDALKCYGKSLSIRPGYALTLINAGMTLGMLERYEEALGCFDSVLEDDPGCEAAIHYRNVLLSSIGTDGSGGRGE